MRELLKLKVDGSDVTVKYREGEDEEADVVTIEASDPPLPSLVTALQAMADHLIAICELPPAWRPKLRVIGVTVTYGDDSRGLVITALRTLQDQTAPLVLNSPHATNEEAEKGTYTMACGDALDDLQMQVWRYVDGERAQLELPLAESVGAN